MVDRFVARLLGPVLAPVWRWLGPHSPLGPVTAGVLFVILGAVAIAVPLAFAVLSM